MADRRNIAWIHADHRGHLLAGSNVLRREGMIYLVEHPSIPPEADHVTIRDGAYVVIPNPDAVRTETDNA